MCFHHKQSKDAQTLQKRFKAQMAKIEEFEPVLAYNGFNHPKTPVILNEDWESIQHVRWGLVPSWSNTLDIKWNTLNAKIETIESSKSYKNYTENRCWVIVDGFYEWQWLDAKGKRKQKYKIFRPNEEAFALGGIYSTWTDRSTGELIKTYTIVTTVANGLMSEIHNIKKRMPIILTPDNEQAWLAGDEFDTFASCDPLLEAVKVDKYNQVENTLF